MSKPIFSEINQVALVVPDMKKAVRVLTEELGVGPLLDLRFGSVAEDPSFAQGGACMPIYGYYLKGQYIGSYGIYMSAATFENNVQLEMITPAGNRSLFQDYLDRHGAGIQHLCIRHDRDYDGYLKLLGEMAVAGNPLESICRVDHDEICAFVDHNERLGISLEVQYRPPEYRLPEGRPPMIEANRDLCPQPMAGALTGLTFASWKMEPVLALLEKDYGIGPWEISGPELHGFQDGIHSRGRTAVCRTMNLLLEVLEPQDPADETDEVVRFLHKNGGNGVFSIHFTAPQGVQVLKAKRRVLFGNDHAGLLDYTEELGAYLKFVDTSAK